MSTTKLILRQIRYTNKAFWRNPASAFFTFAFPLMFLVIFTTLLGNGHVPGLNVKQSTLYVPAMFDLNRARFFFLYPENPPDGLTRTTNGDGTTRASPSAIAFFTASSPCTGHRQSHS